MWGGSTRNSGSWVPSIFKMDYGEPPWSPAEPSGGSEKCLQIRAGGLWNDETCGDRMPTYCEKSFQCAGCNNNACGHGNFRAPCGPTADTDCSACAAHTYGGTTRTATCTDVCPAGQRVNDARSGCDNCAAGKFSQGSVAECTGCRANSWSGVGWGHCDCNAGFHDVSGTCTQCMVGESSVSGGACIQCGPGRTDTNTFTGCKFCEIGFLSMQVGGCLPCRVGQSSATPFTQCEWCSDYQTSSGSGGPCTATACLAGFFAPVDNVALMNNWDHACEPCPYHSISVDGQSECTMCGTGLYANDVNTACVPCGEEQFNLVYPWLPRGVSVDSDRESHARWGWLQVGDLFSIRTPCTCASGRLLPFAQAGVLPDPGTPDVAVCRRCPAGRIDHPTVLRLLDKEPLLRYGGSAASPGPIFSSVTHYGPDEVCEECLAGTRSMLSATSGTFECVACEPGSAQPLAGQTTCPQCLLGTFANQTRQADCVPCALCPEGMFRRGCGRLPRDAAGECETCLLDCPEGEMATACINRLGVSPEPPRCKRKEFLTRTPLCQRNREGSTIDRGLGLGGFDFETIFGAGELAVPFQCSRVCDAQGGPIDTMTCDGPHACNRMSCTMESSYLDTDLNDFRVARACPVEISVVHGLDPLANIDIVTRKRRVACQTCAECGTLPSEGAPSMLDWGRGCVKECSLVECLPNEVYDWTDHSCKLCSELSNASLCTYAESVSHELATQDVSGNRPKLLLANCRAKQNAEQEALTYGTCESCRESAQDCSTEPGVPAFHAGCVAGCKPCMHRQNLVLSSAFKYLAHDGRVQPLYCQVSECSAQQADGAQRTGLKDMGSMCGSSCDPTPCAAGMVQVECSLPHDTRCFPAHPALRASQSMQGVAPAHANLLEHPDSARLHFSNFENSLVNVLGAAQDLHQCVWNAVDIRDNDMNPAGISSTFFPPARTYAFGLDEYGSKFCHRWARQPHLVYPMLPLQNTVSFASDFPRRVLLNASARVQHYDYSGSGFSAVADVAEMPRPSGFPQVFSGDLFLNVDLTNTPNASVQVFVPDDRNLAAAAWIPSMLFSALVADSTAASTVERPALGVAAHAVSRTPRSMLRVGLELDPADAPVSLQGFQGVHCEGAMSRFAVPAAHAASGGAAWVSRNNATHSSSLLALQFAEMTLASPQLLGSGGLVRNFEPRDASGQLSSPGHRITRLLGITLSQSCPFLAVVEDIRLVCLRMFPASTSFTAVAVNLSAVRLESESAVVSVSVRQDESLILLRLSADFGQQWLLHHHDSNLTRDVQCAFDDVVAVACRPADDSTWLLRKVAFSSAHQFQIMRTLLESDSGLSPTPRLEPTTVTLADILADLFVENPDIALSPEDVYAMTVSATGSLFVHFAFVPAQHRYLALLHDDGVGITPLCSLLTEYPGLDDSATSSAWTSEHSLVLHMQDNIFSVRCDGARLLLQHEPQALPNRRFAQLGASYLSLMSAQQVRLSSELRGADLALEPLLSGFCVFVSAPSTTLTVTRLPNAHLRDALVVLDPGFDPESLVDVNALGGLEAVHSPRGLSQGAAHVSVHPQPAAVLHMHPLYAHMRRLQALDVPRPPFWASTHTHLVEIQVTLPCGAQLRVGNRSLQAGASASAECSEACAVLHLTVLESWDANLAAAWRIAGGWAYLKDAAGLSELSLFPAPHLQLYNGARATRASEVSYFSSVQFGCAPPAADREDGQQRQWRQLRHLVSAHSMHPTQALLLQVSRASQQREAWHVPRSLAVDALQLLVVLTAGVPSPIPHGGTAVPASRRASGVSQWIPFLHCCGTATDMFFGVCPLTGNYDIRSRLACAFVTTLGGTTCTARSYVEATSSCHCHSECPAASMLHTQQMGVALMLGEARNFCPAGSFPTDVSSADTSLANCGDASQSSARRLLQADLPVPEPIIEPPSMPEPQGAFYAAMYVPTGEELALLGLGAVLHGRNDAHTDDWQRLFVLVSLEARLRRASMVGCEFRVRLAALAPGHSLLPRSIHSRLVELGCLVRLGEHGVGECVLEVPTALALVSPHRRVALTAEVHDAPDAQEQARCEWPEQDLFTASLVPYLSQNTCESKHFWSQDATACVPCEVANTELVDNVCGRGSYIRGCDAISHMDTSVVDECQACVNADHNSPGSFEWLAGICQWQCAADFFLHASARCEACSSALRLTCGTVAGQRFGPCTRSENEACVPCAPILRGLYSANEVFVASVPGGPECQTECRPKHYRRDDSCRVCSSVANLQLQLDLLHGAARLVFYRFVPCAGSVDTRPELCAGLVHGRYTGDARFSGAGCQFECAPGFHAISGQCVQCALPRGLDGAELGPAAFVFTNTQCDFECQADLRYVLRSPAAGGNASCVLCNTSVCASGSYLTGAACSECRACERRALQNGVFVSRGDLDMPGSCQEECAPGFFADFERCVPHSVVTCQAGEYQMAGTATVDVMCLPCADCRGRRLVTPCASLRNAECAPCPALGPNEALLDTNCSVACVAGALRDANGECEICANECMPGTFRDFSGSHSCLQCAACTPLPANSNYTDECSWRCAAGYTLQGDAAQCEPERPNMLRRAPERETLQPCNESQFRGGDLLCRPCSDLNVSLPAAEGLGVRWRWTRWTQRGAGLCEFECLAPFALFVSADASKFCYTPGEYSAHLRLLHSELRPAEPPPSPAMRPARPPASATAANASLEDDGKVFPGGYVAELAVGASVLGGVLAVCVLL